MNHSVLVVDDDEDLRALIVVALEEAGYGVLQAADGSRALEVYHAAQPDLIILDIGLGGMNGLEVCRRIRTFGQVPILFLTSRAEEADELIGFAAGGDDYVTKPFSPRVLVARVATVLRRQTSGLPERTLFEVGPLRVDLDGRTCEYGGTHIPLTRTEFDILACLIEQPTRVVSREALAESVWGSWYGDHHAIESHMSRLRRKVREAGGPSVGQAVRGVGYKLGDVHER